MIETINANATAATELETTSVDRVLVGSGKRELLRLK